MNFLKIVSIVLLLIVGCSSNRSTSGKETKQFSYLAQGFMVTDTSIVRVEDSLLVIQETPDQVAPAIPIGETVWQEPPYYPEDLMRQGVEGDVVVLGFVDSTGSVRKAILLQSTNVEFNKTSLLTAMKWKFKPLDKNGKLANHWISIPFRYRLRTVH